MREKNSNEAVDSSAVCSDTLEQWAPGKIQAQLQHLLEEAVTTFLGRARHERRGYGVTVRSSHREPKRLRQTPCFLDGEWDGNGEASKSPRSDGTLCVQGPSTVQAADPGSRHAVS
jgi:hypothetical protein